MSVVVDVEGMEDMSGVDERSVVGNASVSVSVSAEMKRRSAER